MTNWISFSIFFTLISLVNSGWDWDFIFPIDNVPYRHAQQGADINWNKMGIHYCKTPKGMSTLMRQILCDVYRHYRGVKFQPEYGKSFNKDNNVCQNKDWYPQRKKATWKAKSTNFAIIRHPIDRFISLYGYLCGYQHDCGSVGIDQFAKDVHQMMLWRTKPPQISQKAFHEIYYHVQPQSWFCDLQQNPRRYHLIRYTSDTEKLKEELKKVFREAGVPKVVAEQALAHLERSKTSHANRDNGKKQKLLRAIRKNPKTMKYLRSIYHSDFSSFNYK